nr:hypothetical protein [Tanacetum cinerariifolium]
NGATLTKTQVVEGVTTVTPIAIVKEKAQRRLEVKARTVEKRFGGNAATKKTLKKSLKATNKNFVASSSEMLDQNFDRLQNLVSQLELLDLDTMSMDDLYNDLKGLSDRFDEYERRKVFDAKRVLEKEFVNVRNAKEFYREFVREPPTEPSARPVPAAYPDDPYVVTRDAAIADAAIATFGIDDNDDDTIPIDSQPHELRELCLLERAEMKVMMTEEFCPPEEIQRMEGELWNLRSGMQHYGNYLIKCNKCGKIGYKAKDCWSKVVATGRNGAHGQAYALRDGDQNLGPNVVT